MIVLGLPLLLPGVCSLLFVRAAGGGDGGFAALGFLISFGGIAMIVAGVRRLRKKAITHEPLFSENAKLILLIIMLMIFLLLALPAVPLLTR